MRKLLCDVLCAFCLCVFAFSAAGSAFAAMSDEDFVTLCGNGTPQEIQKALEGGANANAKNSNWTALMIAAFQNDNPEVAAVLIKNGADVNAKDDHGMTALMIAAFQNDNPEVAAVLTKNGADVNAKDKEYNSGQAALEDLTGYYHSIGTVRGISLMDYFSLDGDASTWAALDKAGFEVKDSDGKIVAGSLRMKDGILLLDFPWTGSVIRFQVLDNDGVTQLRDEESGRVFEYDDKPGDPELSLAALEGKWYLDGDTSKYYYEITSNTYRYCFSDGDEITSGRCSFSNTINSYNVGDAVNGATVTFGDSTFSNKGYFLPDYKTFHMNGHGDGNIYVHETIIGTDEYDTAITFHWFIYSNWKPADESCVMDMFPNGSFEYYTRVDKGDGWYGFKEADSGQWKLSGSELTIVWSDGTEDVCDFAGNTFHVPSRNVTFFNGKAAGGV